MLLKRCFKKHTLIIKLRFIFFFHDNKILEARGYVNYDCQLIFAEHSNLRKLLV